VALIEADFIVVGAGIAGASAAYFLGPRGKVVMLEREHVAGYHSTGRSAALYAETYGNAPIRALTVATGPFLRSPPSGFAEHALMTPRGALFIGSAAQSAKLDAAYAEDRKLSPAIRRIDKAETLKLMPVLNPDYVDSGTYDPLSMDMDVAAIHQGFLRGMRAHGGELRLRADVLKLDRRGGKWVVPVGDDEVSAPVLVNAAGAWADLVGSAAGCKPIGLVPKRRTAFTFPSPEGLDLAPLPMTIDIEETFYFKPEVGQFLGSPGDETPVEPQDIQPDEMDIAIAAERIEAATSLRITRLHNKWAGLRSFVADKTVVLGPDEGVPGFVWCAGQGGYGIQTSAAVGRVTAALACGDGIPQDVAALGVTAAMLSPTRLR
jgi:D-arginine dehydrogenase